MSVETFHFVQKYLENWFEMMATDKKRIPLWSSRMHIALNAYKVRFLKCKLIIILTVFIMCINNILEVLNYEISKIYVCFYFTPTLGIITEFSCNGL